MIEQGRQSYICNCLLLLSPSSKIGGNDFRQAKGISNSGGCSDIMSRTTLEFSGNDSNEGDITRKHDVLIYCVIAIERNSFDKDEAIVSAKAKQCVQNYSERLSIIATVI